MRFIPSGQSSNLLLVGGDSIAWAFSWDRESTYGALESPAYTAVFEEPDTMYAAFQSVNQRILRYSLAADAKHSMWLSTEANPGTAPNTGFFFDPAWYMFGWIPGASADTYSFRTITELTVLCRGYKNPR